MSRERDLRNAIRDAIASAGDVPSENIHLCTAAEAAAKDDSPLVIAIEPHTSSMSAGGAMSAGRSFGRTAAGWDAQTTGDLAFSAQILVTIISRDQDPEARDNNAELALAYLQDGINGQVIVEGFNVPSATLVKSWSWAKVTDNITRMLAATVWIDYLVVGWDGFDTTP